MNTQKTPISGIVKKRRILFQLVGISLISSLLTNKAKGQAKHQSEFKVLGEKDQIDIGDNGQEILEKAYKLGYDFEKKHGGCCRCTVAALQRAIDFVPEDKGLFRAASCLDGGATPAGIQNCGAFTGAGMVIGWLCGADNFGNTKLSHQLIRQVYKQFETEYGNVLCKDVRKKINSNCPEVVARAAKWTAETLLRQFTNYETERKEKLHG
ncbi:MAG: C-GCAxxG-C-C family protein [Phycisphaerae bacterium]|nr:C-GCAxxG-C-C family protein [Phycisphaerae bacterium]